MAVKFLFAAIDDIPEFLHLFLGNKSKGHQVIELIHQGIGLVTGSNGSAGLDLCKHLSHFRAQRVLEFGVDDFKLSQRPYSRR